MSSQSSLISWNDSLQALCYEGSKQYYNDSYVVNALYRPFTKQFLYFQREWIQRPYQMPRLFPATMTNIAIGISGIGHQKPFSTIISGNIADLQVVDKGQYFPLYFYEERKQVQKLFR